MAVPRNIAELVAKSFTQRNDELSTTPASFVQDQQDFIEYCLAQRDLRPNLRAWLVAQREVITNRRQAYQDYLVERYNDLGVTP